MTTTEQRQRQIADFYNEHAATLERIVARRVHGGAIEDACQNAWATLLRRPDITLDHHGLMWLAVVAIREAWRQTPSAETPAGALVSAAPHSDSDVPPSPAARRATPPTSPSPASSTSSASLFSRRSGRASAKRSHSRDSATATTRSPP